MGMGASKLNEIESPLECMCTYVSSSRSGEIVVIKAAMSTS